MKTEIVNGITLLTAEDGKILKASDGVYGKQAWLGAGRSVEEFEEIDEAPAEQGGIYGT